MSDTLWNRIRLENSQARAAWLNSRRFAIPFKYVFDFYVMVELAAVGACAFLTKLVYLDMVLGTNQNDRDYLLAAAMFGGLHFAVFRSWGLYRPLGYQVVGPPQPNAVGRCIRPIMLSFGLLIALGYVLRISSEFSRVWLTAWFVLNCLVVISLRGLLNLALKMFSRLGYFRRRVALVGEVADFERLVASFVEFEDVEFVGLFDGVGANRENSARRRAALNGLDQLIAVCQQSPIDKIIVGMPSRCAFDLGATLDALRVLPYEVSVLPAKALSELHVLDLDHFGLETLLKVQEIPIGGWGYVGKAIEDRILASLILLCFAPIMLAAAIAIKLDSPGPIFFCQRRHGLGNRIIRVWKFRTMTVAEDGAVVTQAQKHDPRVTRIGRFLRKTSLDELPQLFNVLTGEMSLVGPRPHALAHNELYSTKLDKYAMRHRVKPGITGWAQVNGLRGPTDTPEKMQRRVNFDLYYIENWSIWFDLAILLKTLRCFRNENAL
jgi:Undecaprenyl-phosphate glucose phosphotransferase